MEEMKPWVSSKSNEESEFQRIRKEQIESENCYGLYAQQQEDGGTLSSDDKLFETRTLHNNITLETNTEKPSPIPSELLMNSALTAAHDINKDDSPGDWYNTNSSMMQRTFSTQSNKMLLRRETSRSESSLHNDSYSSDTSETSCDSIKEFQSDSATLSQHQTIKGSSSFSHNKRQPLHPARKGHNRSKSDQIGIHHNFKKMNQIDMELSLPGVSKSLPKEYDMTGTKTFFFIHLFSLLFSKY